MKKSIRVILTVLIFSCFIAIPCLAEQEMEQSLSRGVTYGAEGKFEQARDELEKALQVAAFAEPAKRALILIDDMKKKKINPETTISFF